MKHLFLILLTFGFLTTAVSATTMKGDCNNDGNITSVDALIALKMSVGKLKPDMVADMNYDGRITAYDAFKILMLATGDKDELFFELGEIVNNYKVGSILKDARMNWIITENDGSKLTIGVVIENGELRKFMKGGIENPTMNAYTTEKVVRQLLDSKDPKALKKAIDDGKIKLEGVGIVNHIKVTLISFLSKFV
ncbi:dockerin type I repeat-containing protein [Archaeoglobus neptunius]|uniref:dockerin type I repeat-containing protein n=1 Tax=Archaeoglobus neptunius TaxID=2798580 RepID=UPI001928EEFC|nr:dockerin type I repeat-containing protein [Archaeoglobus neptunius]